MTWRYSITANRNQDERQRMSRKFLFFLFAAGLVLSFTAAWFETVPGYMDAEYYYGGALRLAQGNGWTETVLWNYLDNPSGIPHPAHVYWMPLASFLAVPGMVIFNTTHFLAARSIMIILAALISPLTAFISFRLLKDQKYAILSGFLALFPGFYLVYTTDIETYTPYLISGGLILYFGFRQETGFSRVETFLLGILTGVMHLARADGLLWLFGIGLFCVWQAVYQKNGKENLFPWLVTRSLLLILGYGLVMAPWYLRNMLVFASPFPPGTSRALWLTTYNQLFSYPADRLNYQSWAAAGWQAAIQVRLTAVIDNLKNFIGVQGEIILLPFVLAGTYQLRHKKVAWFGWGMWLITFFMMSFVFPLAGSRGGFFHSGSALQIFFWILTPVGLDMFIKWGCKARKWNKTTAWQVFAGAMVVITAGLSAVIYWQYVIGPDIQNPVWALSDLKAKQIEQKLTDLKIGKDEPIMINNPPGYYTANGRTGIVTPDGDGEASLSAARQYAVQYLVLEKAHVEGLNFLYLSPNNQPNFQLLGQINDAFIFRIIP
jgi:hypothetical protein